LRWNSPQLETANGVMHETFLTPWSSRYGSNGKVQEESEPEQAPNRKTGRQSVIRGETPGTITDKEPLIKVVWWKGRL